VPPPVSEDEKRGAMATAWRVQQERVMEIRAMHAKNVEDINNLAQAFVVAGDGTPFLRRPAASPWNPVPGRRAGVYPRDETLTRSSSTPQ